MSDRGWGPAACLVRVGGHLKLEFGAGASRGAAPSSAGSGRAGCRETKHGPQQAPGHGPAASDQRPGQARHCHPGTQREQAHCWQVLLLRLSHPPRCKLSFCG